MRKTPLNRRNFIQTGSLLTAGAMSASANAARRRRRQDIPVLTRIPYKPTAISPGPALVRLDNLCFLTFHGAHNSATNETGSCVITLEGCVDHRFRLAGDEWTSPHTVDIESLAPCQIYLVKRSQWVDKANQLLGTPKPNFRHYVFTFLGDNPTLVSGPQNFECLAQRLSSVDFYPDGTPFEQVLVTMQAADMASGN